MASARELTLVLLAAATIAQAGPCEEGATTLGVVLVSRGGTLAVERVTEGSAAARSGLRVGDEVWQVNAIVPGACADWAKALRAARSEHQAVLLLMHRDGAEVPLVVGAGVWTSVAAAEPARPGAPVSPPARAVEPALPPPTLPPEVAVSVSEVLEGLRRLAPADRPPNNLRAYHDELTRLRRAVETLGARHAVAPEGILGLRGVLRYFSGAEIAWKAIEQQRERDHRPAHFPVPEEMTTEYFEDSAPAAVLEEFPFLAPSIRREPQRWLAESAGLWQPVLARGLLWAKGREGVEQLAAQ